MKRMPTGGLDDRPVWRLGERFCAYGTRVVRKALRACLHGVLLLSTLCHGATRATYPAPVVRIRVALLEEDGPGLYEDDLCRLPGGNAEALCGRTALYTRPHGFKLGADVLGKRDPVVLSRVSQVDLQGPLPLYLGWYLRWCLYERGSVWPSSGVQHPPSGHFVNRDHTRPFRNKNHGSVPHRLLSARRRRLVVLASMHIQMHHRVEAGRA